MKHVFETDRLRVFKVILERPTRDNSSRICYIAFDKTDDYGHPAVLVTLSEVTALKGYYIEWAETMTDQRGYGLARELLAYLQKDMKLVGVGVTESGEKLLASLGK